MTKNNKILFLDEATSNLDLETDQFIQDVLRDKFKNMTIVTIAHKINNVNDYDKIIVVDQGSIVEQGSPHELMMKKGVFYDMVQNSG